MRLRKVAVLGAVVGLILAPAVPASAMDGGTATFVAYMSLPNWGPAGVHPPATGGIALYSNVVCVAVIAGKQTGAGPCSISAGGLATGNCGLAYGSMQGSLIVPDPTDVTTYQSVVFFDISFQISGSLFLATGTARNDTQTGPITLAVELTPTGGSCENGTQNTFMATGDATFAVA